MKPDSDKPSRFEQLVAELINEGYDVNIENEGTEVGIFLENWYLKLNANGKWRIE